MSVYNVLRLTTFFLLQKQRSEEYDGASMFLLGVSLTESLFPDPIKFLLASVSVIFLLLCISSREQSSNV